MPRSTARCLVLTLTATLALAPALPARAQTTEFELDDSGAWVQQRTPTPGSDEALIADAAALIASDQPRAAYAIIDDWISENERSESPWLPRAYLLRGDALTAMGKELRAMRDYERNVIQRFPQSDEFVRAIEREMEIAKRYARGLKRKLFGLRVLDAGEIAEETFIRTQERLPGSAIAEEAAIELADYYARRRNLDMAAVAYDLYVANFPNGPNVKKAMEGRIRANVAQYKGPEYDGASLLDAREQTRAFQRAFPTDAERTGLDDRLIQRLDDAAADQMLAGARWYVKRGDLPSARFMLRRLVRKHPDSPAADDAISIMERRGWTAPGGNEQSDDAGATMERESGES